MIPDKCTRSACIIIDKDININFEFTAFVLVQELYLVIEGICLVPKGLASH